MNLIVMLIAIITAVLAESAMPGWGHFLRVKAPLLMGVVIYYALCRPPWLAVAAAVAGGILNDALCGLPPGCSVITLSLFAALFRRNRGFLFGERLSTHLAAGALAGVVFALLTGAGVALLPGPGGGRVPEQLAARAVGTGLLGMATFPPVFRIMLRLDRMAGNARPEEFPA
ncbi:MAG: rod shape-determining protein MreD [Lentisphaerae bacterium]|nr:rod shape-determining protein MreD [Lentisphaerota bacterium]